MDFCKNPCCLDAGVGHDQRLADTHTLTFLAQQLHGAKVKLDLSHVIDKAMFCLLSRKDFLQSKRDAAARRQQTLGDGEVVSAGQDYYFWVNKVANSKMKS
jgi:hypothetical protein